MMKYSILIDSYINNPFSLKPFRNIAGLTNILADAATVGDDDYNVEAHHQVIKFHSFHLNV